MGGGRIKQLEARDCVIWSGRHAVMKGGTEVRLGLEIEGA